METLLKADIFFFITSVFVVIITTVFLIGGIFLIKIIFNFYKISKILKETAENASADLSELGEHVRESPLFTSIFGKKRVKEVKVVRKKTI
jgi:hypothetical protein